MKAIVQDRYGEAEVLELADIPRPVVGADEVLVRVHAAGVGPDVWHLMAGLPLLVRIATGLRRPKTPVRGVDVAGTIVEVGSGVTALAVGDEVFGTADGTLAEYALSSPGRLALKPARLSFAEAAALPVSGCAALHALRDSGKIQAGQRVLIIGAGGGIGTIAIQLATSFGAEVTGVCSTDKVELVRSLGATHVIDYTRDPLAGEYDLVIDTAGNRPIAELKRILTPTGTIVIVGAEGGGRLFGTLGRMLGSLVPGKQRVASLVSSEATADLVVLAELVTPVIGRSFPLEETAEAVRLLAAGGNRGKIVVEVA